RRVKARPARGLDRGERVWVARPCTKPSAHRSRDRMCHWDLLESDRNDFLRSPGNCCHSAKNLTGESRGSSCPRKHFRTGETLLKWLAKCASAGCCGLTQCFPSCPLRFWRAPSSKGA